MNRDDVVLYDRYLILAVLTEKTQAVWEVDAEKINGHTCFTCKCGLYNTKVQISDGWGKPKIMSTSDLDKLTDLILSSEWDIHNMDSFVSHLKEN